MVTTVARTSINRSPTPNLGRFRSPKIASDIPSASVLFNRLVIQLSLDPRVRSIEYVGSIPILSRQRNKQETLSRHQYLMPVDCR